MSYKIKVPKQELNVRAGKDNAELKMTIFDGYLGEDESLKKFIVYSDATAILTEAMNGSGFFEVEQEPIYKEQFKQWAVKLGAPKKPFVPYGGSGGKSTPSTTKIPEAEFLSFVDRIVGQCWESFASRAGQGKNVDNVVTAALVEATEALAVSILIASQHGPIPDKVQEKDTHGEVYVKVLKVISTLSSNSNKEEVASLEAKIRGSEKVTPEEKRYLTELLTKQTNGDL